MVKIIAHRGASGEVPENTIKAIHQALHYDVDFIEIDVRLSQDGIPLIFHDDSLERMIGHSSMIHEMPFHEIKKADVGGWFSHHYAGERIPALSELFALNWKKTGLMIELKECPQHDHVLVDAVFKVLDSFKSLPHLVLGSFSPNMVNEVAKALESRRHIHPSVELIGIVEEIEFIEKFLESKVSRLAIWDKLVTPELMESLRSHNVKVWSFTVDDVDVAHSLVSMQIDGIISNHPARLKKLITEK